MTDAALGGRAFDPPTFQPSWLRPAVVAAVVALHAAALSMLPYLVSRPPDRPKEVMVDVEPAPSPPDEPPQAAAPRSRRHRPGRPSSAGCGNAPAAYCRGAPSSACASAACCRDAPRHAPAPPPPVAETPAPAPAPPPPAVEAPPPEPAPPPPVEKPAPAPAPVELQPAKPPPRVQPPKAVEAKPEPRPQPVRPKRVEAQPKPERATKAPAAAESAHPLTAAAPASAASQSAYISAMAAAIRSRLFYPPAARARGAKGVVGVAFTIGPSGALSSFAVTHSSGDDDLDAAARTLVHTAHFPPPPGGSAHVSTSFNYVPP